MMPPGEREPPTKNAMAEQLEVSLRTLYNWEAEPQFQEKIRELKIQWGNRWYPDILNSLYEIVTEGPPAQAVQAAKVLLQHIDIKDAKKSNAEFDDELSKRMGAVLKAMGYEVMDDAK